MKVFSAVDKDAAGVEHGDDMSEWTAILDDLTTYLRWRQECGGRTEEFDPQTLETFLTGRPGKASARGPASAPARPQAAKAEAPQAGVNLWQPAAEPAEAAEAPASNPADSPEARRTALAVIAQKVAVCRQCVLCEKRIQAVPGQGNALSPDILFIGEAPGADEDQQGLAFVGAAGQLLTKMIAAMGYTRDEVFIANICKCRPPNNRPPALDEMQACLPYLRAQIAAIRPKTIVALGATAVKGLLDSSMGISRLRGTWTSYAGVPLMPTFHPAYLLRLPPAKKDAWEDLKKVLVKLGKPLPPKKAAGG
jgi:uracil-DNA glycosylase family 4